MYVKINILPPVEHTGDSPIHGPRSYYFLADPAIQFVLWGFAWDDLKMGSICDANWGVSNYRGGCKKLTLRSIQRSAYDAKDVTLLSDLLTEADSERDQAPLIIYLKAHEREHFERLRKAYSDLTDAQIVRTILMRHTPVVAK